MRSRRRVGLSLLELLFAISLLTVVLVAFAAVYPSGYKLNRKSARATTAAKTAAAVAAEIQSLPFFNDNNSAPVTLRDLETREDRDGITDYLKNRLKTKIPNGFILRPEGIQIRNHPVTRVPQDPTPFFSEIFVTVYWMDANDVSKERSVTIASAKTDNKVGR